MKTSILSKNLKWCWLSLIVLVLDQTSKYLVLQFLTLHEPISVLPLFDLTLMHNTGAAFSFLSQQPDLAFWVFSGMAILMSIAIVIWLARLPSNQRWTACALSLVLGGAIGNVIDRFVHGYVIDFLDFYYGAAHFPAFNIADSAICIGAAMMVVEVFFKKNLTK